MPHRKITHWIAGTAVGLLLAAVFLTYRGAGPATAAGQSATLKTNEATTSASTGSLILPPSSDARAALLANFRRLLEDLQKGLRRKQLLDRLSNLKAEVHRLDPREAAAAIIDALKSGEDCATGLSYVIGPEGVMNEAPTYRTALLDLLGQTDPFESAAYSRELMSETGSADEYSLGLRNLAWANFRGRLDGELQNRFSAMLARPDWRQSPTAGYLEAFDVVAATGGVRQAAEIIEAIPAPGGETDQLVGRAAFVALDRLMVADPSRVVAAFRAEPDLLSGSSIHRASLMSRLDVRQPDQAALLRDYLQRVDHGGGELPYFAEIFPNGNYFSSHRLITPWQSGLSMTEISQLDQATAATLRVWAADPAFAGSKKHLESIVARLSELAVPVYPNTP